MPGYTSIEHRVNFMLRISHLEPDAILIYHGNNDLNWSWVRDIDTKLIYDREAASDPGWLNRLIDDGHRTNIKVAIGSFANGFDEAGSPGRFTAEESKLGVPTVGRWFDNLGPLGARRSFPIYNAMVCDIATASGVPLAEPAIRVQRTSEYFADWRHFTAKGEQLMAQIWFETVEQPGWLARAPGH